MPDDPSPTPLHKKLGLKDGHRTLLVDAPRNYSRILGPNPPLYEPLPFSDPPFDLVHVFVRARADLEKHIPFLRTTIVAAGSIWVSWPKRASKVPTDLTEDAVREIALANDLVDVKVCSVDQTWSGLKLVIPRVQRDPHPIP